jgi:hypothetical protein
MANRLQGVLDEWGSWSGGWRRRSTGSWAQRRRCTLQRCWPNSQSLPSSGCAGRSWRHCWRRHLRWSQRPGFVRRFERRLAEQERQAHQRVVLILAAAALGALAGVAGVAAAGVIFLVYTQSPWLAEQVRAPAGDLRHGSAVGGASVEAAALLALAPRCSGWARCRLQPPVSWWLAGRGCSGTVQEQIACLSPCR